MTRNFSAKNGECTDKESRLFRRLRCEKVALRADLIPAQSAKKRDQLSAVSHQLAISIQLLNQSAQHTLDLHHTLGGLSVIVSFDQLQIACQQQMVFQCLTHYT